MFKSIAIAVGLTVTTAVAASAGGMAEPVMEPTIIIETVEEASSASAYVPIIVFALFTAVAANN